MVPWNSGWRYANDGERMLVQPDHAAHHSTIILKMGCANTRS